MDHSGLHRYLGLYCAVVLLSGCPAEPKEVRQSCENGETCTLLLGQGMHCASTLDREQCVGQWRIPIKIRVRAK